MTRKELTYWALVSLASIVLLELATKSHAPARIDWAWYSCAGIPLLCLLSAVLGYVAPRHAWRWGFLPIAVVPFWSLLVSGYDQLWPSFAFAFMSWAYLTIGAAYIGVLLRLRRERQLRTAR